MPKLGAIARQRCPRCGEGRMWRGTLSMNERCPKCGLVFEREQGYFTGAMVVSYLLAVPVLAVLWIVLWKVVGWDLVVAMLVSEAIFLALVPLIFRYSRVIWIHFDRHFDPGEAPPRR